MSQSTTLLVGITGMLGTQIARALSSRDTYVRAIVRDLNPEKPDKQKVLKDMEDRGIDLIQADILEPNSLLPACEGVDVIVSAVSGGEDLAVTGQINLIEAAQSAGVKRIVPSDYAVDYRKLDWGDNYNLDMRKKVKAALEKSTVDHTIVLNGVFTDVLFEPGYLNIFDFEAHVFNYWGDGETLFDTTTIADAAEYIAEAAIDPTLSNSALRVAGTVLSMKQLAEAYEAASGQPLKRNQLGSVEDLVGWIENAKTTADSPYEYLAQQYLYAMVSGKGKLDQIDNERYPDIQPMTVAEYVRTHQL